MHFMFEMSFEEFLSVNKIRCSCGTKTRFYDSLIHAQSCGLVEWREKWSAAGKARYEDMKKLGVFHPDAAVANGTSA